MAMIHTDECAAYIKKIQDGQAAFDARYPKHCTHCGGSGAFSWDDRDVGIFNAMEPCTFCEGTIKGGTRCALCGEPGDFDNRTLSMDEDDKRPCGCPVTEYRPDYDGSPCYCYAGNVDLPDAVLLDQDGDEITDDDIDYAAIDFGYDAWREQQATRSFRGRD